MSRRFGGRGGRRFGGGASQIASVLFGTAGDVYASAASAFSAVTPGTVRVRFRVESVPTTAFKWIAGFSAGSTGWLLCTEDAFGGAAVGQLVAYVGADAALKRAGRKFILPQQVGHVITAHIVLDSGAGKLRFYVDGYEVGDLVITAGFGTAYTSYDLPSAALGIGSRGDGSYTTTSQSVVEVAMSSALFTAAQVLADAQKAVGVAMTSETHRWTASSSVGATWTADTGAVDLTRTGSPSVQSVSAALLKTKRTVNIWGDSVAGGRKSGGSLGNGWRRELQQSCASAGKGISIVGSNPAGGADIDFDLYHNATGAESLNTRLGTLATDMPNTGGATTAVILAYGLNDIISLGRTAAQFATDLASACSIIDAARPGVPIVIVSAYDVAAGSASPGAHTELQAHVSGFASTISTLQATYNVSGADVSVCITDPDDTAQLFDGTHPSPAVYTAMASVISTAMQGLI